MYRCDFCNTSLIPRDAGQSNEARLKEHFLACRLIQYRLPLALRYDGLSTSHCAITVIFLPHLKNIVHEQAYIRCFSDPTGYNDSFWRLTGDVPRVLTTFSFNEFQFQTIDILIEACRNYRRS